MSDKQFVDYCPSIKETDPKFTQVKKILEK